VSTKPTKPKGPKIPIYSEEEQKKSDELNARIAAGDSSAYPELTRLAVRVVNEGRWKRDE
jgi:hypothetical protein